MGQVWYATALSIATTATAQVKPTNSFPTEPKGIKYLFGIRKLDGKPLVVIFNVLDFRIETFHSAKSGHEPRTLGGCPGGQSGRPKSCETEFFVRNRSMHINKLAYQI